MNDLIHLYIMIELRTFSMNFVCLELLACYILNVCNIDPALYMLRFQGSKAIDLHVQSNLEYMVELTMYNH